MRASRTGVLAWACLLAGGASASPFDIVFEPAQTPSESQAALLSAAEGYWESLILGYSGGASVEALTIEVGAYDDDGVDGTLADANWTEVVESGGFVLPAAGYIDFDVADLGPLEESGELLDTLVHEVAHVMGFGTLWVENGVYAAGSGAYTGRNALATYRAEFDPRATFVPVELDGGPGTQDVHWAEDWAGGPGELMTGFADPDEFLSDTTIASFRDLGYETVALPAPAPIPLPAGLWLGLGALGLLGAARRRWGS